MTKLEKEILAQIRNQFTPLLNFFKMRNDVRMSDLRPEQKIDVNKLIDKEDIKAQIASKVVKKLLDSFG